MTAAGRLRSRPGVPAGPDAARPGVHRLPGDGRRAPLLLVPSAVRPRGALLVFFHGAGGTGDQGLRLVQAVAERRGLLALLPTSAGATWDGVRGRMGADLTALDAALATVFARHRVDRVAVGGFSDGASYALSVGLANGDLAEAVLAFAPGFAAPPSRTGRPRVYITHGRDDAVLPIERCGRRVARTLADDGYPVRYEEFDGGHVVPPHAVGQAVDWWTAVPRPRPIRTP